MSDFRIRPLLPADREWVLHKIIASWVTEVVFAHGRLFQPADLPGFAALIKEIPIGLLTYQISGGACEIITLDSWREGLGVGTALIEASRQTAVRAGCNRLFLTTTNNNNHALHFYQKHGFHISALHINAMEISRHLKHEIPLFDEDGLPIRDEIELEIDL